MAPAHVRIRHLCKVDQSAAASRILPSTRGAFAPDAARAAGRSLTRLCIGAYVLQEEWETLFVEERIRTKMHAVRFRDTLDHTAYCLASAAAMHGLPLYRVRDDRVDVIVSGEHPRHSGRDVHRHYMPLPEEDVVTIEGLRITSLDRTVYDVIRNTSLEAAVVVFDAALRLIAWDDTTNTYDTASAEEFRQLVRNRVSSHAGARGIRQARFVTDLADGRACLPGESIARLWMWQLGVPMPQLQYRIDLPDGTYALLDFGWPALRRWAEFDGLFKYTDQRILAGRHPDEVRAAQSRRQAMIEAATGWRCDRWGFERMSSIDEFAKHMRELGLLGSSRPGERPVPPRA